MHPMVSEALDRALLDSTSSTASTRVASPPAASAPASSAGTSPSGVVDLSLVPSVDLRSELRRRGRALDAPRRVRRRHRMDAPDLDHLGDLDLTTSQETP